MTPRELVDELGEELDLLTADGFDEALVGIVEGWHPNGNRFTLTLYDRGRCIDTLMERDGMEWDDAQDFFEFNVAGSYVGEGTPCFATFPESLDFSGTEEPPSSSLLEFVQGIAAQNEDGRCSECAEPWHDLNPEYQCCTGQQAALVLLQLKEAQ